MTPKQEQHLRSLLDEIERLKKVEDEHVSCIDWPRERTLRAESREAKLRKALKAVAALVNTALKGAVE